MRVAGSTLEMLCLFFVFFFDLDMTWLTTSISILQVPKWFWTAQRKARTPEECLQFTLRALNSSGKAWRLVWLLSWLFVWHFLNTKVCIQTLYRPIYHLKYFHFIFIIWIILEEVLNSTLVEIREGKAILLGTLDLASVFQIRDRTSSLHLARPKMRELPRRARFPPFCKDINICRGFQDCIDIDYKMVRTKEIVYFPVCCLTTVLQNSATSDFSHLCVTRSYLRDEKNRELYNRYLSENPDPDVLCCFLFRIRTWSLLQFTGLMV